MKELLTPETSNVGPPYYDIDPANCETCGFPILISLAKEKFDYSCKCGAVIRCFCDLQPRKKNQPNVPLPRRRHSRTQAVRR